MENICDEVNSYENNCAIFSWRDITHVLVAGIGKYHHRKATEGRDGSTPSDDTYRSSILHSIAFDEVGYNQDNQITNRDQCDNARVLERV